MKKRIAQVVWLVILVAFVSLQIYNYVKGNYFDLIVTGLIAAVSGLLLVVVILLKRKR